MAQPANARATFGQVRHSPSAADVSKSAATSVRRVCIGTVGLLNIERSLSHQSVMKP